MTLSYGPFSTSVNGEPIRVSYAFVKKNMVEYMRPHGRFAYCSCEMPFLPLLSEYTIFGSSMWLIFVFRCSPLVRSMCVEHPLTQ